MNTVIIKFFNSQPLEVLMSDKDFKDLYEAISKNKRRSSLFKTESFMVYTSTITGIFKK